MNLYGPLKSVPYNRKVGTLYAVFTVLLLIFIIINVSGCSVELRNNHRAESQLIVDNATLISLQKFPTCDRDKFQFRRLPDGNPGNSGNDYMFQGRFIALTLSHWSWNDFIQGLVQNYCNFRNYPMFSDTLCFWTPPIFH